MHGISEAGKGTEPPFVLLSSEALQYYEKQKEEGKPVYIDSLSYEEFMLLGQPEDSISKRMLCMRFTKEQLKLLKTEK